MESDDLGKAPFVAISDMGFADLFGEGKAKASMAAIVFLHIYDHVLVGLGMLVMIYMRKAFSLFDPSWRSQHVFTPFFDNKDKKGLIER